MKLFIIIDNSRFLFVAAQSANDDIKILNKKSVTFKEIGKFQFSDLNLMLEIFKKNIYDLEQKIDYIFKEVILIINNFDNISMNITGFKKLNGSQLLRENITYVLNSLKSKISEYENKREIIHIFNTNFFLDKKNCINLPIGLFGDFYSHELSFFLINKTNTENLKNIVAKCNLNIEKIISKSFIEGIALINNSNLETFIDLKINGKTSQLSYFENSTLKFYQNFNFGSDAIIKDISKILKLENINIIKFLSKPNFFDTEHNEDFLEREYFNNLNYRKIEKKLILEIAKARIQELAELFIFENINIKNFLSHSQSIFLTVSNKQDIQSLLSVFETSFSNENKYDLKIIENVSDEDVIRKAYTLVQFGWKKEAIPFVSEKKSIIARVFDLFFR